LPNGFWTAHKQFSQDDKQMNGWFMRLFLYNVNHTIKLILFQLIIDQSNVKDPFNLFKNLINYFSGKGGKTQNWWESLDACWSYFCGGNYQPFSENKTLISFYIILTIILTGINIHSYLPQLHQFSHQFCNH